MLMRTEREIHVHLKGRFWFLGSLDMNALDMEELLVDGQGPDGAGLKWLEAGSPHGGVAWTPLQLASALGDQKLVAELLSSDAKPSVLSKTPFQYSELHIAARFGHIEVTRMLLKAGKPGQANVLDAQIGCSPLHVAVLNGDIEMTRLLLDEGGAAQIPTKNGTMPLDLLEISDSAPPQSELRQLLVDRQTRQQARERLTGWLASVGMIEYAEPLMAQGFDDPKFLAESAENPITDEVLDAMKVDKLGHRSKLRALFGLRDYLASLEEEASGEDEEEEEEEESSDDEESSGSEDESEFESDDD